MKKFIFGIISISFILGQTGYELAKMVDEKPTPKDLSNKTKMVLTNSKGKSRSFAMVSKSTDGNKKQIIWFIEPKDDRSEKPSECVQKVRHATVMERPFPVLSQLKPPRASRKPENAQRRP